MSAARIFATIKTQYSKKPNGVEEVASVMVRTVDGVSHTTHPSRYDYNEYSLVIKSSAGKSETHISMDKVASVNVQWR